MSCALLSEGGKVNPGGGRMCTPGGLVKELLRRGPRRSDLGDGFLALGFAQKRGTDTLIKLALSSPARTLTSSVEKMTAWGGCLLLPTTAGATLASTEADAVALAVRKKIPEEAQGPESPAAKLGTVERTAMLAGGQILRRPTQAGLKMK